MTQEQKFLHIYQSIPDPEEITDFSLMPTSVQFEWKDQWYRVEKDDPGSYSVREKTDDGKLIFTSSARLIESHLND